MLKKIMLLEKVVIKANNDYYNTDKPLLTDKTFDILEICNLKNLAGPNFKM